MERVCGLRVVDFMMDGFRVRLGKNYFWVLGF